MNPRVLIVEDQKPQRDTMEILLHSISRHEKELCGIHEFQVDKIGSLRGAQDLLRKASAPSQVYDILLLDLGLPEKEGETETSTKHGEQVLREAVELKAATCIIVISVYSEYEFVIKAFREGAIDFIGKNRFDDRSFQQRVLSCWDTVIHQRASDIIERRLKSLIPYAEQGLTYRLGCVFSKCAGAILDETKELERDICERQGLDSKRDADDPLLRRLSAIEGVTGNAREEWKEYQASLGMVDGAPQWVTIEEVLERIEKHISPCLVLKRVKIKYPSMEKTRALSFGEDVVTVLKEILLGGLVDLPDRMEEELQGTIEVEIGLSEERDTIRIGFRDDLESISRKEADLINKGHAVVPGGEFGRTWGLSIAQHVALRGGGKLVIEPSKGDRGNLITYHIPAKENG